MVRRPIDLPMSEHPWCLAASVVEGLSGAGYRVVFVGGCVRDLLLGRAVTDVDLATDASPEVVEGLFDRCVTVGRQFGVTVVVVPGGEVEVATFRSDRGYVDGRHPEGVEPASEEEDVHRRDFTINALVADPVGGELRDHVGGLADVEARVLRVVGDPMGRLAEDRLRVLRGLRFAAQLELEIDPATWAALVATPLEGLSRERIWDEWLKAVGHPRRSAWWRLVGAARVEGELCPPLAAGSDEDRRIARTVVDGLAATAPVDCAVPAMLLAADRDAACAWLRNEPVSRERRRRLTWLLHWGRPGPWEDLDRAARRRRLLEAEAVWLPPMVQAHGGIWPQGAELCAERERLVSDPPRPLLTAEDLGELGVAPGPEMGRILRTVEDAQLADEIADRTQALALARRLVAEG